ncbi:MAG TPA: PKD domain-containing protein, partial [Steroidobacteraceae bacterium]|nr:PKD domain-containing protein [Steroidobacteraceae bacterium]
KGTLKNQGRVVIPTSTWKVAVILPHDAGLASIHDYRDLQVIAVDMPNEPGVRNVDWHTYLTTVDAIEASSGYDLLALLPDDVENAVESNTQPPIAALNGPANLEAGVAGTFSAAGSLDPNGAIAAYAWDFGDGGTASGAGVTHAFAHAGVYDVHVVVTDDDGLTDGETLRVTVTGVDAPPGAALDAALQLVDQLIEGGKLPRNIGAVLRAEIVAARELLARGRNPAAAALLRTTVLEIDLLVRLRVIPTAAAAPLRALLVQVIGSLR